MSKNVLTSEVSVASINNLFPEDHEIRSVCVVFQSPADKQYAAVFVFEHAHGPYILLANENKDQADFVITRKAIARVFNGTPEGNITDRLIDICDIIRVPPSGFSVWGIVRRFKPLCNEGYVNINIQKIFT